MVTVRVPSRRAPVNQLPTMTLQAAEQLRKRWVGGHCGHPAIVMELHEDRPTGDYVCTICGRADFGPAWARPGARHG